MGQKLDAIHGRHQVIRDNQVHIVLTHAIQRLMWIRATVNLVVRFYFQERTDAR
jgi:hypothetical protein